MYDDILFESKVQDTVLRQLNWATLFGKTHSRYPALGARGSTRPSLRLSFGRSIPLRSGRATAPAVIVA